jgi:hypothetical protein
MVIVVFVIEVRGVYDWIIGLWEQFIKKVKLRNSCTCLFEIKVPDHVFILNATSMMEVGLSEGEVVQVRVTSCPAPPDIAKNLLNLPFWFLISVTLLVSSHTACKNRCKSVLLES